MYMIERERKTQDTRRKTQAVRFGNSGFRVLGLESRVLSLIAVLVLSLLLTGLAYVGVSRAQIKEEDVDFEYMATVTVKKGDSLWVMAKNYYGDPLKWPLIKDMNKIPNEARIPLGTVLYIPVADAKRIARKVEAEIVEKKTVEQELSEKIAALQEELRGLEEKQKECTARNEQLSKELEGRNATVQDLEGMLDNVKTALDKMKDETAKAESEFEAQAREMRAAAEKREAELAELGTARDEKDRQIEELRAELNRYRGDIGRLERLRDELAAKIKEAEAVKPRKPVYTAERRSTVAAIAIALVGSIIWIASD